MMDVLVVDDDRAAAEALSMRLTHAGISVATATNGQDAIRLFIAEHPRVVLLDAALPDISGPQICQYMKSSATSVAPVVVMVSGASTPTPDYVQRCSEASGADHFISKPYDGPSLTALVQELLERMAEPV